MVKKFNLITFFLVAVLNALLSQEDFSLLKQFLVTLQEQSALKKTNFSVSIRDEQGRALLDHNSQVRLIPASTLKLVTTLSATQLLGADFRYHTDFYIKGFIDKGVLRGDLIVIPSGDPSLGSPKDPSAIRPDSLVQRLVFALKEQGIDRIEGNMIILNTVDDGINVHPSWPWDDLANYYAAGTYPFNFHENYFEYNFSRTTQPGDRASTYSLAREVPVTVQNLVTIGPKGSGDNAYFYGAPDSRHLTVKGTIPPGTSTFKIKGAVPHPHEHFANFLSAKTGWPRLEPKLEASYALDSAIFVFRHSSQPLIALIQYANEVSNNLYCDAILKSCGSIGNASFGFEEGTDAVANFWLKNELDSDDLTQVDGSGLSMQNRITSTGMTQFLSKIISNDHDALWKSVLPNLNNNTFFLQNESRRARCWLKSGSISSVLCYAGVLEDRQGNCYSIVLMCNGHTVSNKTIRTIYEQIISKVLNVIDQKTE